MIELDAILYTVFKRVIGLKKMAFLFSFGMHTFKNCFCVMDSASTRLIKMIRAIACFNLCFFH